MNRLEVVRTIPGEGDDCCEDCLPYAVSHYGKFVGTAEQEAVGITPPEFHCVVIQPDGSSLGVVRYYPLSRFIVGAASISPTVEQAVAIHKTHLQKLGEVGITPWYTDMVNCSRGAEKPQSGIFILQDMLPQDAQIGIEDEAAVDALWDRLEHYYDWIATTEQPVELSDLDHSTQYSLLGDEFKLHDIEPRYIGT